MTHLNLKKPKKENKKISAKAQREESEQNALFREVWEEVNQDKIKDFVKKYWKYITAIASFIIILTAGIQFYGIYKNHKLKSEAELFEKSVELFAANKGSEAVDAIKKTYENTSYGYKDAAYSNLYNIYLAQKNKKAAIEVLDEFAKNASSSDFSALAILKKAYLEADDLNITDAEKLLKPIFKSAFKFSAKTLLGFICIKEKDYQKAYDLFDKVSNDEKAPTSIRSVAASMALYAKPRIK